MCDSFLLEYEQVHVLYCVWIEHGSADLVLEVPLLGLFVFPFEVIDQSLLFCHQPALLRQPAQQRMKQVKDKVYMYTFAT